jgi:hypothetical protein
MAEFTGWLLDLFEDPSGGVVLWFLEESGERLRLHQPFPVTFYAAGPAPRLRTLWQYLESQPITLTLSRAERRDLFQPQPMPVLAVEVLAACQQPRLFQEAAAGQRIRFLWLRGLPDVHAWDCDQPVNPQRLDLARYRELTMRAAETVFQPLGLEPATLRQLIDGGAVALPLALPSLLGFSKYACGAF